MREEELLERLDRIIILLKQRNAEKKQAQTKVLGDDGSEVEKYKFGGITKKAKEKYLLFIRKCVAADGEAFAMTPEAAAIQTDISSKTKDIFLSHLLRFTKDGKPLVVKIHNVYYSNFTADEIISFLFSKT